MIPDAPADDRILETLRREAVGYWRTFALKQCIQIDLIGMITTSGTVTAVDVSRSFTIPCIRARLLLDYLLELGLLECNGDTWSPTSAASTLLLRGSDDYVGDWLLSQASREAIRSWQEAFDTVDDAFGRIGDDPSRAFARDQLARHQARSLVVHLRTHTWFSEARMLVDLGCGSGRYMLAALEAQPFLTCLGVDLLPAFATASPNPSMRRIQADLFSAPPLPPAHIVLISNVLHSYDDDACVLLIGHAARLLSPGGRLLLHHDSYEPGGGDPIPVLGSLHVSLSGCRGRVRSAQEITSLCAAAQLCVESSTRLGPMRLDVATR